MAETGSAILPPPCLSVFWGFDISLHGFPIGIREIKTQSSFFPPMQEAPRSAEGLR